MPTKGTEQRQPVQKRGRRRRRKLLPRGSRMARSIRSKQRGHKRALKANRKPSPQLEKALRFLRAGNSQKLAAKSAGVPIKRFRDFLRTKKLAVYRGRKWHFTDRRRRTVVAITTRGEREIAVRGFEPASWTMSHRNAVRKFVETNDVSLLAPFEGVTITDTRRRKYALETRPNVLHRLAATGGEPWELVYRLVT